MAAREDVCAAASPCDLTSVLLNVTSCQRYTDVLSCKCSGNMHAHVYDRKSLLTLRKKRQSPLEKTVRETLRELRLLRKAGRGTSEQRGVAGRWKCTRKRCDRTRKRGKRGGLRAKLRANPKRPALPSILLANIRSLESKMDYVRLRHTTRKDVKDYCVLIFTETWLHDGIMDSAVQLAGRSLFRMDRVSKKCGKKRGGRVGIYINNDWCTNAAVVHGHCSASVELIAVKCRPFYLPREFNSVVLLAVYLPPSANANQALAELYDSVNNLQTAHPEGFFIIAGDFNQANLKTVLPKFHQHVKFATRGKNCLDHVYTTIKDAYRAEPCPHFGNSDHISVKMIPAYSSLLKRTSPVQREIRVWPEGAISALQDCFECTDWLVFREAATYGDRVDVEEYTSAVTGYIWKCTEDVTVSKKVITRANRKPWMTAEVQRMLKARDAAFRSGDRDALRTARINLTKTIKKAKFAFARKIQGHFHNTRDTRSMWKGIQAITDYKPPTPLCDNDASLPDTLNTFYARFDVLNTEPARKSAPLPEEEVICLTTDAVKQTLSKVNPRKAAGPDNIPGRVLRECADQLADTLMDIFHTSLKQAVVPVCFKTSTIVPVPKKSAVSCMNDYRPVALTPIIMKCFERLVMGHIKANLPSSLDPLQFAYRQNRSTDDAISTALHLSLTHLEKKDSHVRMLFIDFSSAFNTIIPQKLSPKLSGLGLNPALQVPYQTVMQLERRLSMVLVLNVSELDP